MEEARRRLLDRLRKEIGDPKVVEAMERVPREAFVPASSASLAYEDAPLPIGEGQTISQPYIVAMMVSALELRQTDRVLEVGTGSGYQAAVLSCLASAVVTIERIASLADSARQRLRQQGYSNIEVGVGDPELGVARASRCRAIVRAAGAPRLDRALIDQLVVGGRLIIPVGSKEAQELMKISRTAEGFSIRTLGPCRFVPLIGTGAWPEEDSPSG